MPDKQNLQPLLDARQNQLSLVFSASDGLDSKALGMLGANLAVLIFIAQGERMHPLGLIIASILFVVSIVCNIATVWSRDYIGNVNPVTHPEYLNFTESGLVVQLLADTEAAIEVNGGFNRLKWRLCAAALVLSISGAALLAWCIL